ncbi:MAG: hypothetical protein H6737_20450 [Alphaproteobacteria bacterium]|nr:hypothetical protein [Alphaproteobacteria bacterium]
MPVLEDPRLLQLLGEADNALALIAQQGDPTGEIAEALDSLFRDIGRYVHELARAAPTFAPLTPVDVQTDRAHFESDGWYTDEIDGDALPLFTEGELHGDEEQTDIPEPDNVTAPEPPAPVEIDDIDVVPLAALQRDASDADGELARLRVGHEVPSWGPAVAELLELLAPPDDLLASSAMPEEASKVQWAAGVLEERLSGLPTTVQLAVLGMLAARALNLAAHLDVDIGPRRALERLKAYRDALDLPFVSGLLPGPHPECDTWAEDAMAYWALLHPGH